MGGPRSLPPRHVLARRPRRRIVSALRRQPIVFWALALVAAATTYLTVEGSLSATAEGAEAYGELVEAVVAVADLDPGSTIGADDVTVALVPGSMHPPDAITEIPIGRDVRHPIVTGEVVAERRLAPTGAVGIAALLEPGQRGVTLPLAIHQAPLEPGQRVDVFSTTDPLHDGGRLSTTVVVESVRVLAVDESTVTVAVAADDTANVVAAMTTSIITVAVAG